MDYIGKIISKTQGQPTQTSASGVWTLDEAAAAVKNNSWPIPGVPNPISKSLRFNSADSAYLNRTPSVAGNRRTWTLSLWLKRGALSYVNFFAAGDGTAGNRAAIDFDSDQVRVIFGDGTSVLASTQVFRDPSAWYHFVFAVDTTQATAANRVKMYVNGSEITAFSTASYPAQNYDTFVNAVNLHVLGARYRTSVDTYFNGYLTEIYLIDGQALTPSSFGQTNANTGVWEPKPYTGTYGGNGFYLNFKDSATTTALGYDYSGNGNNWTPNNFSVTAGAGNDSLVDVPTQWIGYNTSGDTGGIWRGNYATWNPLFVIPSNTTNTFANGNLEFTVTQAEGTGTATAASTMALPTTGKWYWEITPTTVATANAVRTEIGIMNPTQAKYLFANDAAATDCYAYAASGVKVSGSSQVAYGNSYTANDVIGVAVDLDNGAIYFAKNGTWQNSGIPTSGASKTGAAYTSLTGSSNYLAAVGYWGTYVANFGQRPFAYTPPAGFVSLCTTNLPTPTIGATSATQAGKYFNPVLYTGNSTIRSITGVGFQPDFVWIKDRSNGYSHRLADAVRGAGKELYSDGTNAETTNSANGYVSSFDSDGFGLQTGIGVNNTGVTYVAWNWKANGAGSTNTSGTITSTVSANTTAGFSIVTYTATNTTGTIGHGLGVAPSMIIVKDRQDASSWYVYHTSLGPTNAIFLNTTAASGGDSAWNNTAPTSSVFSVGVNANYLTHTHVAYCFAPVAGYSAFGSYTGNGSSDGPMVFTGFQPKYIMLKRTDNVSDWVIQDDARNTYNPVNSNLWANLSLAEVTSTYDIDFVSNGFKFRTTTQNANTGTYIYAAFAEFPFKYSLAR